MLHYICRYKQIRNNNLTSVAIEPSEPWCLLRRCPVQQLPSTNLNDKLQLWQNHIFHKNIFHKRFNASQFSFGPSKSVMNMNNDKIFMINTNLCCIMESLKSGKITIIETSFKKSKIWNKNCKILVKKTKSSTK